MNSLINKDIRRSMLSESCVKVLSENVLIKSHAFSECQSNKSINLLRCLRLYLFSSEMRRLRENTQSDMEAGYIGFLFWSRVIDQTCTISHERCVSVTTSYRYLEWISCSFTLWVVYLHTFHSCSVGGSHYDCAGKLSVTNSLLSLLNQFDSCCLVVWGFSLLAETIGPWFIPREMDMVSDTLNIRIRFSCCDDSNGSSLSDWHVDENCCFKPNSSPTFSLFNRSLSTRKRL